MNPKTPKLNLSFGVLGFWFLGFWCGAGVKPPLLQLRSATLFSGIASARTQLTQQRRSCEKVAPESCSSRRRPLLQQD